MRNWTEKEAPPVYEWTGPTGVKFRDIKQPSGVYYHDTTPPDVVRWLEQARKREDKVRLFLGDRETGRGWLEEHDVYGRVSNSMGPIKIPLLIVGNEMGGGAILTDCIVCLMIGGVVVYHHPEFIFPTIEIFNEGTNPKLPWAAKVNGEQGVHARFKSHTSAKRWADFMQGKRMKK